jgi:tRNA pseudouridine13 synthase
MGELEQQTLAGESLVPETVDVGRGLSQKGDRRPLRFAISEVDSGYVDGALNLRFTLPKGCYATVVLREITKQPGEFTQPPHKE